MSEQSESIERKFENWDQFLDPKLSDEKSHLEIIDEMFSVPAPMEYKAYVDKCEDAINERPIQDVQIVDHLSLLKAPDGNAPYFDATFLLNKFLNEAITDENVQSEDRTAE